MKAPLESALYEGFVRHRRTSPAHGFRYRVRMLYIDLDELGDVFRGRWLWSVGRPNLAWLRRADYLGDPEVPLEEAVLRRVEEELGERPGGAVRMLTMPRTFGYAFNPVTFYWVHEADGSLAAVVAEITNTPWRERHSYVLDARDQDGARSMSWHFEKDFHVSPFHPMEQTYLWRFRSPQGHLSVHMENEQAGRKVFDVTLSLKRRELTGLALARMLLVDPLASLRLHAAIYWQAFRLWWKRTPFHAHPDKRPDLSPASES